MRIITFVTQKGGAGKTTLATSLAVAAQEAGETVALIDLDMQASSSAWGEQRYDGGAETPRVEQFPADRIAELPSLIRSLSGFTTVILDTRGADDTASHRAMEAATLCLVPVMPTKVDGRAIRPTVSALMRGSTPFAFVLNQCQPGLRTGRASEMAAGLEASGHLADPWISRLVDYQDAYAAGKGVTEYAPESRAAQEMRQLWRWVHKHSSSTTRKVTP